MDAVSMDIAESVAMDMAESVAIDMVAPSVMVASAIELLAMPPYALVIEPYEPVAAAEEALAAAWSWAPMARALALNASKELAAGGAGQLTAKIMPLPQWLLAVSGNQVLRKL
jgi:hypothetical protein